MLTEFLQQRPLLLLFAVAAFGYFVGQLGFRGFSLGVSAVLFAGLLVGYLLPEARLPEFVTELGLVLFVYTVGVASGPGFFASLRRRGLRDNALVLGVLLASSGLAFALARLLGLDGPTTAGVFAGALTNTPALAAAVQSLKDSAAAPGVVSTPVLAYSLCYPVGVLGPLLLIAGSERWFRVSYATERISLAYGGDERPIISATVEIDAAPAGQASTLRKTARYAVNFGRIRRGSATSVVRDDTAFAPGDLVTVIGTREDVEAAAKELGHVSGQHLEYDRSEVDYRRMFVSNAEVTERPLADLHLIQRYDAVVTRVRRGDVDVVPDARFELMLGDRVRVLAPKQRMVALQALFGDSLKRLSEVDLISFGLGIALGLLLGAVELPTPAGKFSLGLAGGPLIVGLVLGRVGRTGRLVWTPPYGVNMTLRQFGLVLFLASVGLTAGRSLAGSSGAVAALPSMLSGAVITLSAALAALLFGHVLLKIPLGVMIGIIAGQQTQPAVLAFAVERSGRETPNLGYAAVFPCAMIAKIVLAQVLLHAVR